MQSRADSDAYPNWCRTGLIGSIVQSVLVTLVPGPSCTRTHVDDVTTGAKMIHGEPLEECATSPGGVGYRLVLVPRFRPLYSMDYPGPSIVGALITTLLIAPLVELSSKRWKIGVFATPRGTRSSAKLLVLKVVIESSVDPASRLLALRSECESGDMDHLVPRSSRFGIQNPFRRIPRTK